MALMSGNRWGVVLKLVPCSLLSKITISTSLSSSIKQRGSFSWAHSHQFYNPGALRIPAPLRVNLEAMSRVKVRKIPVEYKETDFLEVGDAFSGRASITGDILGNRFPKMLRRSR